MGELDFSTKALVLFQFRNLPVTTITDATGDPWFVGTEVCAALETKNVSAALARLDADEKALISNDTPGGTQNMLIISEAGLYRLVLGSRKKVAREFQRWVTHDVLPAIRKTGKYEPTSSALDHFPELKAIAELAEATAQAKLLAQQAQVIAAQAEAKADRAEAKAEQAEASAQRAHDARDIFTVAEYMQFEHMEQKIPAREYKAISDYLQAYCMNKNIPFRRVPIGGKPWSEELAYHRSIYEAALPGWLHRRYAQDNLSVIHPKNLDHEGA